MLERRVARREIENQCGAIAAGRRRDIVEVDTEAFVELRRRPACLAMLIVEFQIAVVADLPLGRQRRGDIFGLDMVETGAEAERKGARRVGQERTRTRLNSSH